MTSGYRQLEPGRGRTFVRYLILLRELPGKQSGGRLHSVPLSSATRTSVTSLLRPARGAFRGLSALAGRHRTDACRRLARRQVIAHLFRRGLLAVPARAGIRIIGRRGLLPGHGRIGTGQEGQHFPTVRSRAVGSGSGRCAWMW